MTIKHNSPKALAAALVLLAVGGSPFYASTSRAADPYDKSLEARVEALERELNIMENDSKGKNVQTTEVPTFARASSNVQELVLSGEVRFRYEYDNVNGQTVPAGQRNNANTQTSRERFRFRLYADYKLPNNFFLGAAIQTQQAADSGNSTITQGFDNYGLYLWRFFLGWHTKDDTVKIVLGKQPNPFYQETEMLWDSDISPIGVTEQINYPVSPEFTIGLIAGQFSFYNNAANALYNNPATLTDANGVRTANPNYVPGGDYRDNAYLAYQQIVGTFKPSKNLSVTAAGGYLFYPGHGGTNAGGATNPPPAGVAAAGGVLLNSAAFNSANSSRNLSIGTFDGDVKVGLGQFKVKVYGQGDYNFQGGARDSQEYGQPALDGIIDKLAFATGVTLGSDFSIKKQGDYLFLAEYRQVGLGSVDPNLNDSDFNLSRLGFRGIKLSGSYGFYPWLIGTVTYYGSTNIGHERNLNTAVGNFNASQVVQVDLTAKF